MTIKPVTVLGLMSGSSMDGLDLACCRFWYDQRWHFEIEATETLPYPDGWADATMHLMKGSAADLAREHAAYGKMLGLMAGEFIERHRVNPAYIASHGHTLFHNPASGYTFQLGSGASLAAMARLPVVCDFRSTDVALGGEGAPLVPIGDEWLFGQHTVCLNIGGIANLSLRLGDVRVAWDICPANMALNMVAGWMGLPMDRDGAIARKGAAIPGLAAQLSALPWLALKPPKSLGREWFDDQFLPLLLPFKSKPEDLLHTLTWWIGQTIAAAFPDSGSGTVLITGGGALNTYLAEIIRLHTPLTIVVPHRQIVEFKEAVIFAFLGLLRIEQHHNVMPEVTGAIRASCSGAVYLP